jgi:long-chain fatty acid transport protein
MRRILTFVGVLMWCAAAAHAAEVDITPLERGLRFNFGNPGARALGMGGAFLGRADDASAAEANPAGLTIISKRELTLEFRSAKQKSNLPGQFNLSSTNRFGFLSKGTEYSSSSSAPVFAAFAMPLGPVAISAYYHRPLDFETNQDLLIASPSESSPGVITGISNFPGSFSARYEMTTVGVAAATRLGPFSIGATARRQSLDANSTGVTVGNLAQLSTALPSTLRQSNALEGSSSATSFSAGVLWASATEAVTIGGVYKKGPRFTGLTNTLTSCTGAFVVTPGGTATAPTATVTQAQASNCLAPVGLDAPFKVPDVYGIGMSLRWPNGFTLNEDIVRVKYSQLLEGSHSSVFCSTFAAAGFTSGTGPNAFCTASAQSLGFTLDDTTEVHLGGEYTLPNTSFALRAGVWIDPSHSVSFDPGNAAGLTAGQQIIGNASNFTCNTAACTPTAQRTQAQILGATLNNARLNATTYFLGVGGRELHTSFGLGYVARAFEIHAGYDRSKTTNTASVQLLTRF